MATHVLWAAEVRDKLEAQTRMIQLSSTDFASGLRAVVGRMRQMDWAQ